MRKYRQPFAWEDQPDPLVGIDSASKPPPVALPTHWAGPNDGPTEQDHRRAIARCAADFEKYDGMKPDAARQRAIKHAKRWHRRND